VTFGESQKEVKKLLGLKEEGTAFDETFKPLLGENEN
jgi:hypothetical protein